MKITCRGKQVETRRRLVGGFGVEEVPRWIAGGFAKAVKVLCTNPGKPRYE
jgi:hypothetical protein